MLEEEWIISIMWSEPIHLVQIILTTLSIVIAHITVDGYLQHLSSSASSSVKRKCVTCVGTSRLRATRGHALADGGWWGVGGRCTLAGNTATDQPDNWYKYHDDDGAGDGLCSVELSTNHREVSQCPEKAPTRAFSLLKRLLVLSQQLTGGLLRALREP